MIQKNQIIAWVIAGILLVSLVDLTKADYVLKAVLKVTAFIAIPTVFNFNVMNKSHLNFLTFKGVALKPSIITGILLYLVILSTYLIVGSFVDFSAITIIMKKTIGANLTLFIFVSVYISLINSFVEEFFFRGFAFINLKKYTSHRFAIIFSSLAFALYHITLIYGLFPLPSYLLSLCAITFSGLLFNLFDDRENSIYPSWIIHGFANLAFNTIGVILLWLR